MLVPPRVFIASGPGDAGTVDQEMERTVAKVSLDASSYCPLSIPLISSTLGALPTAFGWPSM
ncbi:MAG: hypothetical protein A4E45_01437 [Methanosaeta sp. PtaB.Bin039]|nr:MAG: hypothetical protein A4E45_01437 [Methanosaeta sp. PtaB.Bin039]